MKKRGVEITFEERQEIERLLKRGFSLSHIAIKINRSKTGIRMEVEKRGGREQYNAVNAQQQAESMRFSKYNKLSTRNRGNKVTFKMKERIENLEMQVEILADTIKRLLDEKTS